MTEKWSRRKLLKYVRENDISKLKSYVHKYSIDVARVRYERGNTMLHLACEFGSDVVVRFLLRSGADLLAVNDAGEVPLHLACYYALEGHKYAETDLILPLIRKCPESLDIQDNRGVTAKSLKDRLMDIQSPKQRRKMNELHFIQYEDYSSEDDEYWSRKIADEAQAELDDFGRFSVAFDDDDDYAFETYDQWAERMAREYSAKHSYSHFRGSQTSEKHAKSHDCDEKPNFKISEEKKKRFDENSKIEREQEREKEKLRQRICLTGAKANYERACDELFMYRASPSKTKTSAKHKTGMWCDTLLGFDDVPWPQMPGLGIESAEQFLFGDLKKASDEYRSYLRRQQVRWHPDRFLQRCGHRIVPSHRQRIVEKVNALSQLLNSLSQAARPDVISC